MADITIKDLTAGTPLLTDLLIFANPTTGLAKKATFTTLNGVLTLAGLGDISGAPANNSILEYDSGAFTFNSNFVRSNALNIDYIPYTSAISPYELTSSQIYQGIYGIQVLDNVAPVNLPSVIFNLVSTEKGFLKPRMSTDDRTGIVSPATGLEVYDTTLNLPYYYNGSAWVAVGSGGGSGLTSLNALTASTQTFATSSTGTDFTISSATSTHTFNLPSASASNRGLLTAANWTTFNNKQAALVSGTNIKTINTSLSLLGTGNIDVVNAVSTSLFDNGSAISILAEQIIEGSVISYNIGLNIPSASATVRGALTSTDWTTFNSKQATLVSGTNIKTVNGTSLLGSGNVVISGGTGLTSLNALTAGTQLFAVASTGTDFTITSVTDTHTFSIPTASATARGLLSSANWTTFNSKQDALISGTNIKTINGVTLLGSGNITTGTGNGTVTSVGLNVSIAAFTLTATANPITTSGTFTIAAAGDSTQYINGAGNLVTFPTFSSTSLVVKTVRNQTGSTLAAGTVVYINGASGNIATVAKADPSSDATSAQTFGVTQAAILNNSNGVIVLIGDVTDLNTSAYTDGTQLYLGTAGTLTATKPYAPIHLVYVGIVTRAHLTQGVITVKIQNGYELDELHDVSAQSPANNDGIFFNTSTSLWEKKSISTVLGYVPQAVLSGTGFVKSTAGTISYDTSTYLTANQSITLSGDVTGSGATSISTTLATVTQASSGNFVKVTLDTKGRVTGNTAVLAADITALGFASSLITTNRQTSSYTLVIGDANKLVELNVATANTLTVPLNSSVAFPIGTQILVSQYGAGACTIIPISGVTVRSEGAKLKTNGQYAGATLVKIATDEWYAFGNLIA